MAEGQAQGTPVLMPYLEGAVAIWQADLGSNAHVMTAYLGDKLPVVNGLNKGVNSELPAASLVHDQMLVAYIQSSNNQRSVWLLRKAATARP